MLALMTASHDNITESAGFNVFAVLPVEVRSLRKTLCSSESRDEH
jgi:hypothetical protein